MAFGEVKTMHLPARLLVLLLLLLPVAAPDAAPRLLTLAPRGNQVHTYAHGVPWLAQDGPISVAFSVDHAPKRRLRIDLVVVNSTDEPLTIIDSSVTAVAGSRALKVFGYDALAAEEKRRRMWEGIAIGLAAGANAYSASQQGHYTQYGHVSGTYGSYGGGYGTFSGSVRVHGYDPVAASIAASNANFQNAQMISALQAQQASRGAALESTAFRSQTIAPGSSYGGFICIELPRKAKKGSNHQIDVRIGDLATFSVFVDATPSSAQLAALPQPEPIVAAVEENLAAEPELAPVTLSLAPVRRAEVMVEKPLVSGKVALITRERAVGDKGGREYVFLDVDWLIDESLAGLDRISGKAELLDAEGKPRLQVVWPLERQPSLGTSFREQGVGWALDEMGVAEAWLRSVDVGEVQIRYLMD